MKRALLFSGQGAQLVGMGQDLAASYSRIAALYREADEVVGYSLSEISFEGPEERLTATAVCQPALYVHGYALATLLMEQHPQLGMTACAGLSLGEYTAHAVAGTFSFRTGLELVHRRATLMQQACEQTQGGMLTLLGADDATAEAIAEASGLQVANYNCPGQIVLSGEAMRVPLALEAAKERGVRKAIPLKVAGAYHSRLMASAEAALRPALEATAYRQASVAVTSNFTGAIVPDAALLPDLLARQVTGSVRWESCVRSLLAFGIEEFIELGPGGVLAGLVRRIAPEVRCHTAGTLQQLDGLDAVLKAQPISS